MKLNDLTVKDIMSAHVETLDPADDVDLADMVMRLDRLHHLPVVDQGQLVGLVTQRDVARHQVSPSSSGLSHDEQRRTNLQVRVRDIMVSDVVTVGPDASLGEAVMLMRARYLGCLPVVEDKDLVGIVTGSDLLNLLVGILEEARDPAPS